MTDDAAREIKYALGDARALCETLGLVASPGSFTRQAGGYIVRCPAHEERTPSCSVQARQGIVLWRCHGCGESGDALDLVALVNGLTMRGDDFKQVLILGAELGGLHSLVAELEVGAPVERRPAPVRPTLPPEPDREYPPADEIASLLAACVEVDEDHEVAAWLAGRGLSPDAVSGSGAALALPVAADVPRWASYRGQTWTATGHRLIVPMFDASGVLRTVRAGRVNEGDSPKRLPPGGHKASGVVMACALALGMLRGTFAPTRIVISEGEPDALARITQTGIAACARIGIVSGSWTEAFAARIPTGAKVSVRTDNDEAGDRYAKAIIDSLSSRCELHRRAA